MPHKTSKAPALSFVRSQSVRHSWSRKRPLKPQMQGKALPLEVISSQTAFHLFGRVLPCLTVFPCKGLLRFLLPSAAESPPQVFPGALQYACSPQLSYGNYGMNFQKYQSHGETGNDGLHGFCFGECPLAPLEEHSFAHSPPPWPP